MNRIAVAKELVAIAKSMTSAMGDLSPKEQAIAEILKTKGYTCAAQLVTIDGDFGEPLYFKKESDVDEMLRTFPAYKRARMKWRKSI